MQKIIQKAGSEKFRFPPAYFCWPRTKFARCRKHKIDTYLKFWYISM